MDKTTILEMLRNLPKTRMSRITLYLNIDRVKEQYFQNGGLETVETSDALNSEVTGGIDAVIASVGSNISTTEVSRGQLSVTPLLMAILLEEDKRRNNLLLDPTIAASLPKGAFLKHVADTRLVRPSEIVNAETSGLLEDTARIVQAERERQVKDYEDLGIPRKTIVWVTANKRNLASILSTEFLNPNSFTSFAQGLIGILGLLENETPNVRFITPLWMWHEGFKNDIEK